METSTTHSHKPINIDWNTIAELKFPKPISMNDFQSVIQSTIFHPIKILLDRFIEEVILRSQSKCVYIQSNYLFGLIHEFTEKLANQVSQEDWQLLNIEELMDSIESYIMKAIYKHVFSCCRECRLHDVELSRELTKAAEIIMKDFKEDEFDSFLLIEAQEQLLQMSRSKTPQTKLDCILKTAKIIYELISTKKSQNISKKKQSGHSSGADEFFPVFVFILALSNPPCLYSSINFIGNFRHPRRLIMESNYYFTSLTIAIKHIQDISNNGQQV